MNIVMLVAQTAQCSTHRDDIIVGMWTEYNDLLWIWIGTFRTIGVVGIRFATRPSGNSVLNIIEYLDVYIVSRSKECKQFAETIFAVVFVGELQDRFACQLAEPNDSATGQLVVPLACADQPRVTDTRQFECS